MISYQEEKFKDIRTEFDVLLQEHYKELGNEKKLRPLDVDYDLYQSLNESGVVRFFTVKDGGILVGYAAFYVSTHPRYRTWLSALCDLYYVIPAWRKEGIGSKLFEYSCETLKACGVRSIGVQDNTKQPHGKFFKKLGYKKTANVYEKVI